MPALLHGLLVGALLSCLRAPLGLNVVELVAVSGDSIARLRAAALFAIAALVLPNRPLFRGGLPLVTWLFGILGGLALHGLLVAPVLVPGRFGLGLALLAALPLFWFLSARGPDTDEAEAPPEPGALDLVSATLAGAGIALGLDAAARHARLFSIGLPEDDTLLALVLGGLVFVGLVAFGRPSATRAALRDPARGRLALALGAALFAPGLVLGLRFLGGLNTTTLDLFLRRFGLDFTQIGLLPVSALLFATGLVLVGFATGFALGGLAHARRLRAALFGGAFGSFAVPLLVRSQARALEGPDALGDPFAWRLALVAGALTLIAALLQAIALQGRARLIGLGAATLAIAFLALGPRPVVALGTPWWRAPIEPLFVAPSPAGLLSVEREYGVQPTLQLSLDRRRMTPLAEEEPLDADRLAWSWSLLPAAVRESGAARVLFVGQVTPARAAALAALPPHQLDRVVPWDAQADAVDAALFAGSGLTPPGTRTSTRDALVGVSEGDYDLVVVPPTHGALLFPKSAQLFHWGAPPAPRLDGLAPPEGTLLVAWIDATAALSQGPLPGALVPAAREGLQSLTFGLVYGASPDDGAAGGVLRLPAGDPVARPTAWSLLNTRAEQRNYDLQRRNTERLAAAGAGQPFSGVAAALAAHAAPQQQSSPYDSRARQIELSEEALQALLEAARETPPDPATRRLWEGFAWLLFERREPGKVLTYLEPVAEAYGPWPLLERVVARAYQEFDMPAEASAWMERVLESGAQDIDLLAEAAEWRARTGDFAGSAALLERADGLQPGRFEVRRLLGMMWVRAGDARGTELLTELLIEHPEDTEIAGHLGVGPLPPLPEGFLPALGLHSPAAEEAGNPGHEGHDH